MLQGISAALAGRILRLVLFCFSHKMFISRLGLLQLNVMAVMLSVWVSNQTASA